MDYVFVTLRNVGVDLKISLSFTGEELRVLLGGLYGINVSNVRVEPGGIILNKNKTLAEQQLAHGSILELV